jgi:YHS domain-containing protein
MIRLLFRFIVLPVLLFYVVRAILRSIIEGFRSTLGPQSAARQPPAVRSGGELKKDPVCGTYVSTSASITRTVGGEVFYFCSKECSDRYREAAG